MSLKSKVRNFAKKKKRKRKNKVLRDQKKGNFIKLRKSKDEIIEEEEEETTRIKRPPKPPPPEKLILKKVKRVKGKSFWKELGKSKSNLRRVKTKESRKSLFLEHETMITFGNKSDKINYDKFDDSRWIKTQIMKNGIDILEKASDRLRNDFDVIYYALCKDPLAIRFSSEKLRENRDLVMLSVSQNGNMLRYASPKLQNESKIVIAALKNDAFSLEYASPKLQLETRMIRIAISKNPLVLGLKACQSKRNDRTTVFLAVTKNGKSLEFASEELRNDPHIVNAALSNEPKSLEFAGSFRNDRNVVSRAISRDGLALKFASPQLRDDEEIVNIAIGQNHKSFQFCSERFRSDKNFALKILERDGNCLEFVHSSLRNHDIDIVRKAISQNGDSLLFASEEMKKNKSLVSLAASRSCGRAFRFAHESVRKDREFVLSLVFDVGECLKYADDALKLDKEIVMNSIMQDGMNLKYADERLRKDREIVRAAVTQNGNALKYACNHEFVNDREIVITAVSENGESLQYASEELKKDEEICSIAVTQNLFSIKYIDPSIRENSTLFIPIYIGYTKKIRSMFIVSSASSSPSSVETKTNNRKGKGPSNMKYRLLKNFIYFLDQCCPQMMRNEFDRKWFETQSKEFFDVPRAKKDIHDFLNLSASKFIDKHFYPEHIRKKIMMYDPFATNKRRTKSNNSIAMLYDVRPHIEKSCSKYFTFQDRMVFEHIIVNQEDNNSTSSSNKNNKVESPSSSSSISSCKYIYGYLGFWNPRVDLPQGMGFQFEVTKGSLFFQRRQTFHRVFCGEFSEYGKREGEGREYDSSMNYGNSTSTSTTSTTTNSNKKFHLSFYGLFKNDLKHGKGIEFNEDGVVVYEGLFRNGVREGDGEMYDGKNYIKGIWENGRIKSIQSSFECPIISLQSIKQHLTHENLIGVGGIGMVYKLPISLIKTNIDFLKENEKNYNGKNKNGKYVAIKIFNGGNSGILRRLVFELVKRAVETCGLVSDTEHILEIKALIRGNQVGYVTDLCRMSVDTILPTASSISMEEKFRILYETAKGIRSLHEQTIMHRDLKWSNVLVTFDSKIKITDFDTAKSDERSWKWDIQHTNCHSQSGVGTAEFIAPEIYSSDGNYGLEVDIFSYGLMIYSLLYGLQNPYSSQISCRSCGQLVKDIRRTDLIRHVSECRFRPLVNEEMLGKTDKGQYSFLMDIMQLCWESDPSKRPSIFQICEIYETRMSHQRCFSIIKIVVESSKTKNTDESFSGHKKQHENNEGESDRKKYSSGMKILLMKPSLDVLIGLIESRSKFQKSHCKVVSLSFQNKFSLSSDEDIIKMLQIEERPTVIVLFDKDPKEEEEEEEQQQQQQEKSIKSIMKNDLDRGELSYLKRIDELEKKVLELQISKEQETKDLRDENQILRNKIKDLTRRIDVFESKI